MAFLGLKEAYESAKDRLGDMTLDQFVDQLKDAKCHPMFVNGKVCGAVIVKKNIIHACILPWAKNRWFSKKAARILNRVIDEYGEAVTSATTEEGKKFVERLGFEYDGERYRSKKKWVLKQSLEQ